MLKTLVEQFIINDVTGFYSSFNEEILRGQCVISNNNNISMSVHYKSFNEIKSLNCLTNNIDSTIIITMVKFTETI